MIYVESYEGISIGDIISDNLLERSYRVEKIILDGYKAVGAIFVVTREETGMQSYLSYKYVIKCLQRPSTFSYDDTCII